MSARSSLQDRGNGSMTDNASSGVPRLPVVPVSSRHDHRLKPLEGKPAGTLLIHEIYRSLQGESTFAGLPCVFIRLTACNLRCVYCDTPHAFTQGEVLGLDEVMAQALELGDDLVEITGGEPLLQPEVYPLMARLADAGKTVLLETSGAIDTSAVDPRVRVILDIKTPGSGEVEANVWSNLDRLKPTDEVKVVVCDRADFDWAAEHRPLTPVGRALPRPVQRGLRSGQSDRAGRLDPRIRACRSGSSSSSTRSSGTPPPGVCETIARNYSDLPSQCGPQADEVLQRQEHADVTHDSEYHLRQVAGDLPEIVARSRPVHSALDCDQAADQQKQQDRHHLPGLSEQTARTHDSIYLPDRGVQCRSDIGLKRPWLAKSQR